jgi:hypothetical protein
VEPQQPASQRRGESVRTSSRSGRGGGSGKFLAIFLGVIVLMITVCAVLYVKGSSEKSKADEAKKKVERVREQNLDRVYQAFLKAHSVGKNFVTGADPNATEDQLFGPFRGDSNIYNVIYTRNYKDKKRDTFAQKMLDAGRKNIAESGNTTVKEGVQIKNGRANDEPIMTARKAYSSDAADQINQGGEILVIVNAQKEPD